MAINTEQLLDFAVKPVLDVLAEAQPKVRSPSAEIMLLSIAAHESHMGSYIHQVGGGPARSIYQFEPATIKDAFDRIRTLHPSLWDAAVPLLGACDFETDLKAATCAARLNLWLQRGALPPHKDSVAMARYWHEKWCRGCAGTIEQFLRAWDEFIEPLLRRRYT